MGHYFLDICYICHQYSWQNDDKIHNFVYVCIFTSFFYTGLATKTNMETILAIVSYKWLQG